MDGTCPTPAIVDVARWIGMVIAVLGAISISPSGTSFAFSRARQQSAGLAKRARRLLPLAPSIAERAINTVGGVTASHSNASMRALVALADHATVDHKVDILDQRTRQHDAELNDLQKALRQLQSDTESLVQSVGADLEKTMGGIEKRLDEMERTAIELDARALPVILLGIVFSGLGPDLSGSPLRLAS